MVKHCPECGYKLDREYNFCPECGFEIRKIDQSKTESRLEAPAPTIQSDIPAKFLCDNCGEENDINNSVCSSCGAKLREGGLETSHQNYSQTKKGNTRSLQPKSAGLRKNNVKKISDRKQSLGDSSKKKLDIIKTVTIVVIGLGVALIILIFSGVLNSVVIPGNTSATNTNQKSSIYLNNAQKINSLEEVVKNNPKDKSSILELAHLKNDAGMYEQAIVNYKQYLALATEDPDARIDLGICYYNLQNYDTAIKEMELALKYDPSHQIGYLDLGIVYLASGNMGKSKESLQKAVQLDPNSEYGKKAEELLKSHNNQTNGGN